LRTGVVDGNAGEMIAARLKCECLRICRSASDVINPHVVRRRVTVCTAREHLASSKVRLVSWFCCHISWAVWNNTTDAVIIEAT